MSSPTDPNLMSPDVLSAFRAGKTIPTTKVPINMVDLPLGATEDRVCGTIDIEKALTEGTKAFEPGLLAKANRAYSMSMKSIFLMIILSMFCWILQHLVGTLLNVKVSAFVTQRDLF